MEGDDTLDGLTKAVKNLELIKLNEQLLDLKQNNTTHNFNNQFHEMDISNEDKLKIISIIIIIITQYSLTRHLINTTLLEIIRLL